MTKILPVISKHYTKSDGTSKLYLQVFLQKRRIKIPTSIDIEPSFWCDKERRISDSHPKSKELNAEIIKQINKVNEVFIKYMLKSRTLTPELLIAEVKNPSSEIDFLVWMRKEIDRRVGQVELKTIQHHNSILGKLKEFRTHLTFSELNTDTIIGFEAFLKNKKKNIQTTIHAAIKVLKTYVLIAYRRDLIEKNPFDNYKLKKGESRIIYLSSSELEQIWEYFKSDLILDGHKKALIPFLFSCSTGLRLSDVKLLMWSNIINDLIYLVPKKTKSLSGKNVKIPLNSKSKYLLKLATDKRFSDYVFNMQSEQVLRRHLKDIAFRLKINKDINFNTARHTFATLFWERTKDIATLSRLLGHTNIAQTMVYAHVSDEMLIEQMKTFDS